AGLKHYTLRTKAYGKAYDVVDSDAGPLHLLEVRRERLDWVQQNLWKEEGCSSPEEFRAVWESIHPYKGWTPNEEFFLHRFERANYIFVFGSNRKGIHGSGAALSAIRFWGAVYGEGEGLHGQSYALPTKETPQRSLSLEEVEEHVDRFISYAWGRSNLQFKVTRVGCGLAGFTDAQIAPMFAKVPPNVSFFEPSWYIR
ncbi:MAG: hypothetical protein ABIW84_00485, partial [Ilumatobacteraceae bacterium]